MYVQKIIANKDNELWRSKLYRCKVGDTITIPHPSTLDRDGNMYEFRSVDSDEINVLKYGRLVTPLKIKEA